MTRHASLIPFSSLLLWTSLAKELNRWRLVQCIGCEYKVLKRDGTLYKHGHGESNGDPCPGSYKPPNSVSSIDCSNDDGNIHDTQPHPSMDTLSLPRLEHPMWKATMNRIPKAARVQCVTAFSDILIKIANDNKKFRELDCVIFVRTDHPR